MIFIHLCTTAPRAVISLTHGASSQPCAHADVETEVPGVRTAPGRWQENGWVRDKISSTRADKQYGGRPSRTRETNDEKSVEIK